MADQPKERPKKFLLPSALRHLQESKKIETQHYISHLHQSPDHPPTRTPKPSKSLFKLNPSSAAVITELPQPLRKRSKSQKQEPSPLEPTFSLLDHYKEAEHKQFKDKKHAPKKYNIDLRTMAVDQRQPQADNVQEQDRPEIVKPSETYQAKAQRKGAIFHPTLFQTPILPCFASEFHPQPPTDTSKRVNEGEGVWRVGKLKVKGKTCELRVGEFVLEGSAVRCEGKGATLNGNQLFWLPNWNDMWILQPAESIFL